MKLIQVHDPVTQTEVQTLGQHGRQCRPADSHCRRQSTDHKLQSYTTSKCFYLSSLSFVRGDNLPLSVLNPLLIYILKLISCPFQSMDSELSVGSPTPSDLSPASYQPVPIRGHDNFASQYNPLSQVSNVIPEAEDPNSWDSSHVMSVTCCLTSRDLWLCGTCSCLWRSVSSELEVVKCGVAWWPMKPRKRMLN